MLFAVMREVTKRMKIFKKVLMGDYQIYFNNKNLSEILGQVMVRFWQNISQKNTNI